MKKRIDKMGRITLPVEIRKQIGLDIGDEVEMEYKNNSIILTNPVYESIKEYVLVDLKKLDDQYDIEELKSIINTIENNL